MTGLPAMTMAELYAEAADKAADLHWSGVACWCGERHGPHGTHGLVSPPWAPTKTEVPDA